MYKCCVIFIFVIIKIFKNKTCYVTFVETRLFIAIASCLQGKLVTSLSPITIGWSLVLLLRTRSLQTLRFRFLGCTFTSNQLRFSFCKLQCHWVHSKLFMLWVNADTKSWKARVPKQDCDSLLKLKKLLFIWKR